MKHPQKSEGPLYGILAVFMLIMTTTLCSIPVLIMGLLKLFPNQAWKVLCTKGVDLIASYWCSANNRYLDKTNPIQWEISGTTELNPKNWYLVIANHQSWLDIVVLQRLFNRKIPVLKFFIKDQLKWIPLLGFSWWAMGCPFMKRYSPSYLAKYPHKKGKDLEATKKALRLFKQTPATIMNFIEGTRYSAEKKQEQNSPYQHLLKPRAGGISFVISSMHQQITHLLDVTIIYPPEKSSLWHFLCRRVDAIKIHVRQLQIPAKFLNTSLPENDKMKADFHLWINQQWSEKDHLISMMKPQP